VDRARCGGAALDCFKWPKGLLDMAADGWMDVRLSSGTVSSCSPRNCVALWLKLDGASRL
jgi:hypothetical protein